MTVMFFSCQLTVMSFNCQLTVMFSIAGDVYVPGGLRGLDETVRGLLRHGVDQRCLLLHRRVRERECDRVRECEREWERECLIGVRECERESGRESV